MPKWAVTHEDGRVTEVHSPEADSAKKQALHQQISDLEMVKGRRSKGSSRPEPPAPSIPVSVVKIKE